VTAREPFDDRLALQFQEALGVVAAHDVPLIADNTCAELYFGKQVPGQRSEA